MKRKRLVKLLMADGAEKRCAEAIASEVVRFYGKYKIGGYGWIDLRKPENRGWLEIWKRYSGGR